MELRNREKSESLRSRSSSCRNKRISSVRNDELEPETQNVIVRHVLGDICSIANCSPQEARLRLKNLRRKYSQPLHKFLQFPQCPIRQSVFDLNPFLWKEVMDKPMFRKHLMTTKGFPSESTKFRSLQNVTKIPVKNSNLEKGKISNRFIDDRIPKKNIDMTRDPFLVRGKSMSIEERTFSSIHFDKKSSPLSIQRPTMSKIMLEVGLDIADRNLLVNSSGKCNVMRLGTDNERKAEEEKMSCIEAGKESSKKERKQKIISRKSLDVSAQCFVDVNSQNKARNNDDKISSHSELEKEFSKLPMEKILHFSQYTDGGALKSEDLKSLLSKSCLEKFSLEKICLPIESITSKATLNSAPITQNNKSNKKGKHRNRRKDSIQLNYSSFPYIYYIDKTTETRSMLSLSSYYKSKTKSKQSRQANNRIKDKNMLKIGEALEFPDFPLMCSSNFATESSSHMIQPCNAEKENIPETVTNVDPVEVDATKPECTAPPKTEDLAPMQNDAVSQPQAIASDKLNGVELKICRSLGDIDVAGVRDLEASFGGGGEYRMGSFNFGASPRGLGVFSIGNGRGEHNGGEKPWLFGARGYSTGGSPCTSTDALKKNDGGNKPENCTCLMRREHLKRAKKKMIVVNPEASRHPFRIPESLFSAVSPKDAAECAQAPDVLLSPPATMATAVTTAAAAALEAKRMQQEKCKSSEDAAGSPLPSQAETTCAADDPSQNKCSRKRPRKEGKATACETSPARAPCEGTALPSSCSPPTPAPAPAPAPLPQCAAARESHPSDEHKCSKGQPEPRADSGKRCATHKHQLPPPTFPDEQKSPKDQNERKGCSTSSTKLEVQPTEQHDLSHKQTPPCRRLPWPCPASQPKCPPRPPLPPRPKCPAPPPPPPPPLPPKPKCPSPEPKCPPPKPAPLPPPAKCPSAVKPDPPLACPEPKAAWLRRLFGRMCPAAKSRCGKGGSKCGGAGAGGRRCFSQSAVGGGSDGDANKSPGRNTKRQGVENKHSLNDNPKKMTKSKSQINKEKWMRDVLGPNINSRPPNKIPRTELCECRRCRRLAWTLRQKLESASSPRPATPFSAPDVDPSTLASLVVDANYLRLSAWNDFSDFPAPPKAPAPPPPESWPSRKRKRKQLRPKVWVILENGDHRGKTLSKRCSKEDMKRKEKSVAFNIEKIASRKSEVDIIKALFDMLGHAGSSKEDSRSRLSKNKSRHLEENSRDIEEKTKKIQPSLRPLPDTHLDLKEGDTNLFVDRIQEHPIPNRNKESSVPKPTPKNDSRNNIYDTKKTLSHSSTRQQKSKLQKDFLSRTKLSKTPFPPEDFIEK